MSGPQGQISWRRILLLLLFAGIAIVVITRFAEARELASALRRGRPLWLTVGIVIHSLYFVMDAQLYRLSFDMVGVEGRMLHLLPIVLAGYFVNAAFPSGGTGTAALFIDDARRRGESGARTAVGTLLSLLVDLGTMLPFVAYAAYFLYRERRGLVAGLAGGSVFTAYIVVLTGMLLLAQSGPVWLQRGLDRLRNGVNQVARWFRGKEPLDPGWPERTVEGFAGAAQAIVSQPRKLLLTAIWGLLMHLVSLAGLYAFLRAFGQQVAPAVLVAAFAMGTVFFVVTVIPHVVAAVEGIMLLILTSAGVPPGQAGAAIVVFRGVTFWLPVILGFLSLRQIRTFRPKEAEEQPSSEEMERSEGSSAPG